MQKKKYRRILLKISGEGLMGNQHFGVEGEATQRIAKSIVELTHQGTEVAVVIGGGNIFRGIQADALKLDRSPADNMGMLATIFNGVALQQAINSLSKDARLLSALECPKIAESYTWQKASDYMQRGKVVIFVGGTGNPYFTTDTAAALRASEIRADLLLKATKVDGIYDKDPLKHSDATRYNQITYTEVLHKELKVMDGTAVALCRDSNIPILVFSLFTKNPWSYVLDHEEGTLVTR